MPVQDDAIAAFDSSIQSAKIALFQAGVASVPSDGSTPVGISPAQEASDIQVAVAAAVAPLNDQISAMQLTATQESTLLASAQLAAQNLVALFTPAAPVAPPVP